MNYEIGAEDTIPEREELDDQNTIEGTVAAHKAIPVAFTELAIHDKLADGDNTILVPSNNAIYMYLDELKNASFPVQLTDEEFLKYKYRPDLISYTMYGSDVYEYVILAINDMISPKYFDKSLIYVIDPEYMEELISMIADAENEYIQLNKAKLENKKETTDI